MKCLIIKKEHLDRILDGSKTWEMRSRMTKVRGKIGLIESRSGLIVGECEIYGCVDMSCFSSKVLRDRFFGWHRCYDTSALEKWNKAWIVENAKRYDEPIPYKHPQGAVIWVNVEVPAK